MRYLCLVRWSDGGPVLSPADESALIREHLAHDQVLRASGMEGRTWATHPG